MTVLPNISDDKFQHIQYMTLVAVYRQSFKGSFVVEVFIPKK